MSSKCKLSTRNIRNYIRKCSFVEGRSFMPRSRMLSEHHLKFPFVLSVSLAWYKNDNQVRSLDNFLEWFIPDFPCNSFLFSLRWLDFLWKIDYATQGHPTLISMRHRCIYVHILHAYTFAHTCKHTHTHTHTYRETRLNEALSLIICRHHRPCVRRNAHAPLARGSRKRANALLPRAKS